MIEIEAVHGPGADALAEALKETLAPLSAEANIRISVFLWGSTEDDAVYIDVDRISGEEFLELLKILRKIGKIDVVYGGYCCVTIRVVLKESIAKLLKTVKDPLKFTPTEVPNGL